MTEKKGFEDWKALFQEERKGISIENHQYRPVPEIQISPYIDIAPYNEPLLSHPSPEISHSLVVDQSSAEWLCEIISGLEEYQIISIHAAPGESVDNHLMENLQEVLQSQNDLKNKLSYQYPTVLNFSSVEILSSIKKNFYTREITNYDLAIIPGDDFIRNVGFLRGLQKFKLTRPDKYSSVRESIYITLGDGDLFPEESQLISLTNQILSLMVGGLNHIYWDLRNANEWQKSNLNYLLNIPEILLREGKVIVNGDPLRGSGLFEELSDKVSIQLQQFISD